MQALWMVLASFWFALMAVGIKYASHSFGTFELVFYRGVVSVVFMAIVVRAKGTTLKTTVPAMHLWRTAIATKLFKARLLQLPLLACLPTTPTLKTDGRHLSLSSKRSMD